MFSGEFIYRREDVSVARSAKKWLYEGRCVKASEMGEVSASARSEAMS